MCRMCVLEWPRWERIGKEESKCWERRKSQGNYAIRTMLCLCVWVRLFERIHCNKMPLSIPSNFAHMCRQAQFWMRFFFITIFPNKCCVSCVQVQSKLETKAEALLCVCVVEVQQSFFLHRPHVPEHCQRQQNQEHGKEQKKVVGEGKRRKIMTRGKLPDKHFVELLEESYKIHASPSLASPPHTHTLDIYWQQCRCGATTCIRPRLPPLAAIFSQQLWVTNTHTKHGFIMFCVHLKRSHVCFFRSLHRRRRRRFDFVFCR